MSITLCLLITFISFTVKELFPMLILFYWAIQHLPLCKTFKYYEKNGCLIFFLGNKSFSTLLLDFLYGYLYHTCDL